MNFLQTGCGTPLAPSNGMVEVNSDGSVATYTCDVGFTLSGLESRNCQTADATWEGTDPTCSKETRFYRHRNLVCQAHVEN